MSKLCHFGSDDQCLIRANLYWNFALFVMRVTIFMVAVIAVFESIFNNSIVVRAGIQGMFLGVIGVYVCQWIGRKIKNRVIVAAWSPDI